jgi:NAD(P)-dependent dehydrogenase (short-subunit alcohol dehydrogenase family)
MSVAEGSLFDLSGKNAVITGSSKGIGRAIAEQLALHGANVVISSRKADACQVVADEINAKLGEGAPNRAVVIPAHIGDKAALQNLVDQTHAELGQIDVLICNAAVNPFYGPSKDIPDSAFEKIMNSNPFAKGDDSASTTVGGRAMPGHSGKKLGGKSASNAEMSSSSTS